MRKMRTMAGLAVLAALTLALCACGGASSPYAGTWVAAKAGMGEGLQFDAGEIFEGDFIIEIDGNGTCTVNFGGESGTASWSVTEDGAITISDGDVDMIGTIDETTMKLDLQNGVDVTFLREGAGLETEPAEAGEGTEEAAEEAAEEAEQAAEEETAEETTEEAPEEAAESETGA